MTVFRSQLSALGRKYRVLGELRRGVLSGDPPLLRKLAEEFPGALRELDCLPLDAIDRRLDAVTRAEHGSELEPWIEWMLAYHRLMRLALAVKRRLAGTRRIEHERAVGLALELRVELSEACDAWFVERAASPPGGRLNRLVFEELAGLAGQPSSALERALFPELSARAGRG